MQADAGSVLGLGRSPGGRNGNPLRYSCLDNRMARRSWQTTVRGVAESDMTERLGTLHTGPVLLVVLVSVHFLSVTWGPHALPDGSIPGYLWNLPLCPRWRSTVQGPGALESANQKLPPEIENHALLNQPTRHSHLKQAQWERWPHRYTVTLPSPAQAAPGERAARGSYSGSNLLGASLNSQEPCNFPLCGYLFCLWVLEWEFFFLLFFFFGNWCFWFSFSFILFILLLPKLSSIYFSSL